MLGGGAGVIGIECCIGVGRVSKQSRGIQVQFVAASQATGLLAQHLYQK